MGNIDVNKNIPIIFQKLNTYDVEDTRFLKVKIWLMHLEENLNGSYFSKEVVENAISSLSNTPILAYIEYNDDNEKDASDHRIILVKEDGKLKTKYIGQAVGIIPETNNAKFEMRVCDDGVEREFLTVEGLLWTKFDDPVEIMIRDVNKAESMEIHDNYQGDFQEDNLFHFSYFQFYGACILGKDVQPAMNNASIELQFSYDEFKNEIQDKMELFKNFSLQNQPSTFDVDINKINTQEGGSNKLDEKIKLLSKYNLTTESISFNIDELSLEEIESKIKEQFSLSNSQLLVEIDKILQTMTEVSENYWGELKERRSYYLMDLKDNNAIVVTYNWDTYYGIPYTVNGDIVTLNMEEKVEWIPDWRPKQAGDSTIFTNVKDIIVSEFSKKEEQFNIEITEVNNKFTAIETEKKEIQDNLNKTIDNYTTLESEIKTLKETNKELSEFKSSVEKAQQEAFEQKQKELKEELVENFSKILTPEEIKLVIDKNLSVAEMETEFKLVFASKELTNKFSKRPKKTETEIPIINFSKKKDDDWTSLIRNK